VGAAGVGVVVDLTMALTMALEGHHTEACPNQGKKTSKTTMEGNSELMMILMTAQRRPNDSSHIKKTGFLIFKILSSLFVLNAKEAC